MRTLIAASLILFFLLGLGISLAFTIPNKFKSGDIIEAEKFNANFEIIKDEIEGLNKQVKNLNAQLNKIESHPEQSDYLVRDMTNALAKNQPFADLVEQVVSAKIDLPVGTILPSLARPSVFLKGERAKVWARADGGQISPDSSYAKLTEKMQTPDLRGMFLRGLNAFQAGVVRKDGNQDPDGDGRNAGSYQADAFKKHNHDLKPYTGAGGEKGHGAITAGTKTDQPIYDFPKLTEAGDSEETRPKNIAVFFYIKIN